jgi:four helix bundle protein
VRKVHKVHKGAQGARVHRVRGCDAAASGPRNIAEGFGRYYHPEFARFARIAKASEQEVLNHLYRARNRNYITPAEFEDAAWAARKALKAVNGLIRYLDDTPEFGKG